MRYTGRGQSHQTRPLFSCTFLPLRALQLTIQYVLTFYLPFDVPIVQAVINSPVHFRTFYVWYIHTCGSLLWSDKHFFLTICFLLITCLLFGKDSFTCALFMLDIFAWFRHLGTLIYMKQLQAIFPLDSGWVFNWFSQLLFLAGLWTLVYSSLLHYIVVPFLFQVTNGLFTLWLPIDIFVFSLQCSEILFSLASFTMNLISLLYYLLQAWSLRFHALLLTSIGHVVLVF